MIQRLLIIMVAAALTSLFVAGCSFDWETGSQGAGQECGDDSHCSDSLVCIERRCRPVAGGTDEPDAGDLDTEPTEDIPPSVDAPMTEPDIELFDGPPPICTVGETRCISPTQVEECSQSSSGPQWRERSCAPDEVCEDGECVLSTGPECCPGGCDEHSICHNCTCTDYDPEFCLYQDQPCSVEGEISGGFVCTQYGQFSEPRCFGLCSTNANNPDETCPEDDSVCFYENDDDPNGICFSNCSIGDFCTDDGLGCVYHSAGHDDGLCLPATGGGLGSPCNPDDFFDCADEGICIGGICQQSCRPFDQSETDCNEGYCLALSHEVGVCAPDTATGDGSCTAEFTTCGEDATICTSGVGPSVELTCYNYCRLQGVNDDCDDSTVCEQFDPNNPNIGVCTMLSP